jgi:pyruvate ferredoxin oxidoreductase alpha subunit
MTTTRIMTANTAAAIAAALSRVQVIAAYPITPQTPVTEELASMVERGELQAEYLTVESEHSAMAAVTAASQMGARVFTATSANGLLYMHEMLHWAAGSRSPVVMACVNRGVGAPWTILNDQQDSISQRDTGWIQIYCRNGQEVIDSIIQGFRISEQVKIPLMVCYDGFVLSHASTPVEVPSQELVDGFLANNKRISILDDRAPANLNPLILSDPRPDSHGDLMPGYMELRYRLHKDLLASMDTITLTDEEFAKLFGRRWGGLLWTYQIEDADHLLVSMGSLASECTVASDILRSKGLKTGVLGIRTYRPFPAEAVKEKMANVKSCMIFEKDVSYGYEGALASDLKAAFVDVGVKPKFASFVAGLGGRDIRPEGIADQVVAGLNGEYRSRWMGVRGFEDQ